MVRAVEPKGAAIELTARWAGRRRTLALGPWRGLILLVALPILAASTLCASLYLVFHDDLLAALISRQTQMQYAYEDRIATLRAELEGAGASDATASAADALAELREHAARLDARAATLEAVAGRLVLSALPGLPAAAPLTPALRLGGTDATHASVALGLAHAEAAQDAAAQSLLEPGRRAIERFETALRETGLPPARWRRGGDATAFIGGPFVPLGRTRGFEASLATARAAADEAARLGSLVDRVPLRRPIQGPIEVSSPFGPRPDPFLGRPAMHTGIDLAEEAGDAVAATASGTVTIAGPDGGYGNMVEVDHGAGLATRYAHLSVIEVAVGQRVAAGDIVGRAGATGRATGPHLHYETRVDGEPVDPARFLRAAAVLDPER